MDGNSASSSVRANTSGGMKSYFLDHSRALAPLATLLVLICFFSLTAPGFFSLDTLASVLRQVPTRAIVGTGLTFVLLCGEIDLSVAMVATFSACQMGVIHQWMLKSDSAVWVAASQSGAPEVTILGLVAVFAFPVVIALVIGFANGALTVISKLPSFIITLAMMEIAYGLASYITHSSQYVVPPILRILGNDGIRVAGRFELPYAFVAALFVMLAAHLILVYTRFGRHVYAVGGNREAARYSGVRTGRIVAMVLAISGLCAALGGFMNAGRLNSAGINQNEKLLLEAVACVVLGGTSLFGGQGGIKNTLVGVLAFTVLDVGLRYVTWIDEFLRRFLLGAILLSALILNGQLAKLRGGR